MGTTAKTTSYVDTPIDVRLKLSALWIATMLIFLYVDLLGFFREDFRTEIEAGEIAGFTIDQTFLVMATTYILFPALMVFLCLMLKPAVNRIANIVLALLYSITIVASAIGEWTYFILGSIVELILLAGVAYSAWTWPKTSG